MADEILQDVMCALSAGVSRLTRRTVAGLKTFASGIVSHKVADAIERKQQQQRTPDRALRSLESTTHALSRSGPVWHLLTAGVPSPATVLARREQTALLLHELGRLKPEQREVIVLTFFDQLATRDVADQIGISRAAASMLLIRAVRTLRRNMTGSSQIGSIHGDII